MRAALLHGFAGDPSTWDEVLAAGSLPRDTRAVALTGHGGGPVRESWDENLDDIARAVAGSDVVIGYSLGARIALGLVATNRVARAVLISVNPGIDDAERPTRRANDKGWATLLRTRGVAAFEEAWTAQALFASQRRADATIRERRRTHRLAHDPEQLARSLETMGLGEMPDYRPQLPALRDRIAVIAGADDAKFAAIARSMPAASLELVPDSGHDPTLEQPAALAAAITRALVALA